MMNRIFKNLSLGLIIISILLMAISFTSCKKSSSIDGLKNKTITMISHFDPGYKDTNTSLGKAVQWWESQGGTFNMIIQSADIYPTKLMSMAGAGNMPDIVMVDQRNWMPRLAVINLLQPVDKLQSKSDLLDYEQNVYDNLAWEGKHYSAFIMGAWSPVIWYNKTMFDNAGIETPRQYWNENNWTWDTFLKVAQELTQDTNKDGKTDIWGFSTWDVECWPASNNASMVKTNSDGTVDIIWDQKPFTEAAQFAADLVNKYKVTPTDLSFHVNGFKSGNLAMSEGTNDFVKQFCQGMTDEVDNAPLPLGPNQDSKNPQFIGNSLFLGLGNGAKNIDGAEKFISKMREYEKELRRENYIAPNSNLSVLTKQEIETCAYADAHVKLNYESGFGDWANTKWGFWGDILYNKVPVATALAKQKPVLENEIKTTLDEKPVEVKPFVKVPVETFELGDLNKTLLTQTGIDNRNKVNISFNSDSALDGNKSLEFKYNDSDSFTILARTDETKIALPSYHRYIITFDYKLLSSNNTSLHLTIRPKASVNTDATEYGFETVNLKAGQKGSTKATIDVLSQSTDNVLVFIAEETGVDLLIDNLQITEG